MLAGFVSNMHFSGYAWFYWTFNSAGWSQNVWFKYNLEIVLCFVVTTSPCAHKTMSIRIISGENLNSYSIVRNHCGNYFIEGH